MHIDLEDVVVMVKCDKCEENFTSKGRLSKHRQCHHSDQSYTCEECGKVFPSKPGLKSHERKVHQKEPSGLCAECGGNKLMTYVQGDP